MAAAALFPMAAVTPNNGNCFSGSGNSVPTMTSCRSPRGAHSPQRAESPPTQDGGQEQHQHKEEQQQHWQERLPATDEANRAPHQRHPLEVEDSGGATSVASLRPLPSRQGTQQPPDLLQRSQGSQGASNLSGRSALAAKTSSLLQRKQQFYKVSSASRSLVCFGGPTMCSFW